MAAALKEELGVEADLRVGRSGTFDISVDGKVVAGRSITGFPTEQEVVDAVARALGR